MRSILRGLSCFCCCWRQKTFHPLNFGWDTNIWKKKEEEWKIFFCIYLLLFFCREFEIFSTCLYAHHNGWTYYCCVKKARGDIFEWSTLVIQNARARKKQPKPFRSATNEYLFTYKFIFLFLDEEWGAVTIFSNRWLSLEMRQ